MITIWQHNYSIPIIILGDLRSVFFVACKLASGFVWVKKGVCVCVCVCVCVGGGGGGGGVRTTWWYIIHAV